MNMIREEADALIKDLPPIEDPMAKWRREADEAAERRAKAKAAMRREEEACREAYANAGALAEMDARLEAKVAELVAALAELVVEERERHCRELEEFKRELKAEFAEQLGCFRGEMRGCLAAMK